MKINSNLQAMVANSVLKKNEAKYGASTEKLSSGYKINHASDSPSGMAISNKMRAQINSLNKARDNTSNAVNVVQTADGALQEVHSMLQRMNELAIKASNGTMTETDREAIQSEITALSKEIDRVAKDTEYNTQNLLGGDQKMKGYTDVAEVKVSNYDVDFPVGKYLLKDVDFTADPATATLTDKDGNSIPNLKTPLSVIQNEDGKGGTITAKMLDGSEVIFAVSSNTPADANVNITGIGGMKIQVGSSTGQEIQLVIPSMDTESMGIKGLDMRTQEGAQASIARINSAIEYVSKARSNIGAYQNRFESTLRSLDENIENLTESYSTIKDIDMAEEMVNYTTSQVLVQAGTSMLTQANEQPQQALQLLQ